MTKKLFQTLAIVGFLCGLPGRAFAHVGVGDASGLLSGFLHPVSGLDHIVAMVLVGMLAWQLGGRARWLLPVTFVLVMAIGGVAGMMGIVLPMIEIGIAVSIIVLGLAIALNIRTSTTVGMAIVGACAIFHGYAHGAEMPDFAGGLAYALGFMAATASLHAAGLCAGFLFNRFGMVFIRVTGGFSTLLGIGILAGTL